MGRTVVGLDIGSSGVRATEIVLGRRDQATVRAFAAVPLPEGAVRAGLVADTAAVAEALRRLWKQGRFSTKAVSFGLANDGMLVRQLDLDWMPPADFRKAIRYQVAEILPVQIDDTNLDYHVLDELDVPGDKPGETRRVVRILLVAAAREVVDGFVEAIRAAGLRPMRADLRPFALIRLATGEVDPQAPAEAIVDIGADTVAATVHSGGRPRFVRIIPGVGSASITRALAERFEWSAEQAEHAKIRLGLPAPGVPVSADTHEAQQVITQQVRVLVSELRATLDYFRSAGKEGTEPLRLSRIVVTGNGSRLTGLTELLTAELGTPVERLDPFTVLRPRRRLRLGDDDMSGLATAAGLCLGVAA